MVEGLDKKDMAILRELDRDFRTPFSRIAKRVGLSKNSVSLRFRKLQEYISHSMVALNYSLLGYSQVRVFLAFDAYDQEVEDALCAAAEGCPHIAWLAKYYGRYDVCAGLFARTPADAAADLDRLLAPVRGRVIERHISILGEIVHLRHGFLLGRYEDVHFREGVPKKTLTLAPKELDLLRTLMHHPRMPVVEVAEKTGLCAKSVSGMLARLEKEQVIRGYFMTLHPKKFGLSPFKLLLQAAPSDRKAFEGRLVASAHAKFIGWCAGFWECEIDVMCGDVFDLEQEIEALKRSFPGSIRRLEILTFAKRLYTRKETFL